MKKIITLILALALVLSLSLNAFAATGTSANNTATIEIENTVGGTTYKLYRIFELESFDTSKEAYAYKLDESWPDDISGTCLGTYISIDADGYVTWKEGASAAAFATAVLADVEKVEGWTADGEKTAQSDNETLTFADLPLGYYVVDSSLGSVVALTTPNDTVTITEKNAQHSLDKKVKEGTEWGTENDANALVDTVEYKITIDLEGKSEYAMVVHDTMSSGLTFNSTSVVGYLNEEAEANKIPAANYTVDTSCNDGCTFHITIHENYCKARNSADTLIFTYSAVLNENALSTGLETNTANLEYNNTTTADKTVTTKTYQFEVVKTDVADEVITGAEFELYSDKECTQQVLLVKDGTYYRRAATTTEQAAAVSIEAGQAVIKGLDAGTYYLKESKAPNGYNKLKAAQKVELSADNLATVATADGVTKYTSGGVQVVNETGILLPSFGGMGTTLFYVAGGAMVLAAILLLVTKKRMSVQS